MHSQLRRLPAERARHAKRLGHVNPIYAAEKLPDPPRTTSSTAEKTSTTALKTTASVSGQTTSSTAVSSTVSTTSSASTTSTTATSSTPLISSPNLQPSVPPSTSVYVVHASPSNNPNSDAASASGGSKGLSGGAIGAIVALSSIVGAALLVFFIRKTYLRRRQNRRVSWNNVNLFTPPASSTPNFSDLMEKPVGRSPSAPMMRNAPPTPMSPFDAHGQSVYPAPAPQMQQRPPQSPYTAFPPPPPASYNNPVNRAYSPHPPTLSPASANANAVVGLARVAAGAPTGGPTPPPAPAPTRAANDAIVKCTFIPTLPDELSITTGERVHLLAQYDDGWALCANGRGEQGMVPQECLERQAQDHHMYQEQADWRNMRRASSLNPDGRQF